MGKGLAVDVRIQDCDGSNVDEMLSRWADWYVVVAIVRALVITGGCAQCSTLLAVLVIQAMRCGKSHLRLSRLEWSLVDKIR